MTAKEYIKIISQHAMKRAVAQTRVGRKYRTKSLSKLTSFYRNRFYELDGWYKARIIPPEKKYTAYQIDHDAVQKSIEQRLAELDVLDEEEQALRKKVNIGFKWEQPTTLAPLDRSERAEELSRNRELLLNIEEINEELYKEGASTVYPEMVGKSAQHYEVFKDCFHDDAYFYPVVPLKVSWQREDESYCDAYFGNCLDASDVAGKPSCSWQSSPDRLWTLLCLNLDGNLEHDDRAAVLWMVANINSSNIASGTELVPWLQPLPFKGTGFHRVVFLLFSHGDDKSVDFQEFLNANADEMRNSLTKRDFDSKAFYRQFEDCITPAGLAFAQVEWDNSCTECFHNVLGIEQPIYEYEHQPRFVPEQQEYFKKKPFNTYLDTYRDEKNVERELLLKRLRRTSPFEKEQGRDPMENLLVWEDEREQMLPWELLERQKERFGSGRYRKLYENRIED